MRLFFPYNILGSTRSVNVKNILYTQTQKYTLSIATENAQSPIMYICLFSLCFLFSRNEIGWLKRAGSIHVAEADRLRDHVLVGGHFERMRGFFHRKKRIHRRVRTWLSALALVSVSTISLRANALVAACGSEENLRIDDATGLENLKAAVNCSGGGSVVAVWSGDVTLESPVLVGSGTFLAVLGQREGGAVARGGSQTRLFEVSPGAQLTLSRLKIAEGSAPQGGAILSYGSLTLDTCEFDGNVATNKSGGAVWAGAGDVTISGVEFSGNSATSFGGAVFTLGAELVIDGGARFDANQAEEGGAVYCRGSNGSSEDSLLTASCTLRDAVFLGNNASMEKDVDLSDVVNLDDYTNNVGSPWRVLFGGGAATFVNAEVNISNCDFIKNSAQVAGGALYGGNATKLNINGCTFEGNSAVGVGGAVAASSATFGGGTELRGNNASSHGGGVSTPHSTLL